MAVELPPSSKSPQGLPGKAAGARKFGAEHVRLLVLGPLTLGMVLLVATFLWQSQASGEEYIVQDRAHDQAVASRVIEEELEETRDYLEASLIPITNDDVLGDALARRDTAAMKARVSGLFSDLKQKLKISHFYFHSPEGVNLLRMHSKESGDKINRVTLNKARETGQTVSGLECGPIGTFVLRSVRPFVFKGQIVGYVELGKEFSYIAQEVGERQSVQSLVVVNKSLLNKSSYEKGLLNYGRQGNWDEFKNVVVMEKTIGDLPASIAERINQADLTDGEAFEVLDGNRDLSFFVHQIRGEGGVELGTMLVMSDITDLRAAQRSSARLTTILGAGILVALVLVFFFYLGYIERRLGRQRSELVSVNEAMRESARELEARVAARTSQLQGEINLRKESDRILKRSEERFRALIEHSSDNISMIDAQGNALFQSPAVEAMLGYKPAKLVGHNMLEMIHPDERPAAAAAIQRAFEHPGKIESLVFRMRHKDGSWRVLETTGRAVPGENGRFVAILNSRDITLRRRAEEALRASERRFDLAVQGSAVGIWDTKVNGAKWRESFVPESPVYWSPRIAEMWGVDYADLPHTLKPWIERVHPDDAARVFQAVTEHIEQRKPYNVELRMRHADGKYRWFQARADALRDENGVPTRMAGSLIDISEHKHAEEVLRLGEAAQREAAQLQRDVLNALPANVALLNERGVILSVNGSWREFGKSNALQHADSCVGVNYIQLCDNAVGQDSAEAAQVAQGIRAVIAGQSHLFALQYSCHAPWEQRWFRLMVAPVDRAGVRGCVVMHIDVTERVLAEIALRRNAAKLAEAQRIGGVGSFEMNLETFEVNWSDEASRIYGVERNKKPLTFDTFLSIVHPDDAAKIREATETALKTGLPFEIEHRVVHADKSVHFINSHVEVVRSPEGKPILLTGTNEDITRRKETEREIRLGAQMLADAQRIGRVGSFEQDIERKTAVWSDETYRIMGIDKKASPARFEDFMERVHPDDRGLIFQTINEATLSHKTAVLEFRIIRKDAEVAFLRSHIEVTFSPDGKPVKFSGTCQDITEQKQAESQLADNARVLKEKNTQLDVALVQANEATRLKGEFLANMSHEIRTPMNGVIGMTGLLLETALTHEQKEYAEIIRNSGEALLCIINDILDFSKIEAGRLKLEPVEFDLQQAVHDVAELLAKGAQDKGLELLVRFERDCPRRIVADPGRLRQVLLNLMGNGVKFTKKGHVLVEVSASAGKDPGSTRLKVSVQDTGIGMAADKIPHVFEKFFQADASTTRVFGGTGLGLPICKQLVELMGGEIHVESELGKGTTVSFEIEVPRGAASEEEVRVNSLPKDIRALVVDDDEVARRVLSQLCTSFGMKCDTADSGMEALTKMRAAATQGAPYTLALLDMRMPLMDGAQLARTIKKDEQLKSTRLAIVSAFARPDDSTLPIGMVEAVLTKPVRADVLLPVLTRMFRGNMEQTTTTHIKPRTDTGRGLLEGKRVLVVEDNAVNQKLVSRMLEKLGCKFDMAANGNEAVGMALNMHFDLVLMDCQMPELDGYDATREIRRRMGHQRLPIVAMTANAMQGDRDKCLAAGMDDYISKPMKFEDVRDTLTRWLIVAPGQATVARMTPRHVASN